MSGKFIYISSLGNETLHLLICQKNVLPNQKPASRYLQQINPLEVISV